MPSIVYERCRRIVELCKEKQYMEQIPLEELKRIITENIAADPRMVRLYISRLQYFGLMQEINPRVMRITRPEDTDTKAAERHQDTLDGAILKQWGIKT